jgi:hypothetical protein
MQERADDYLAMGVVMAWLVDPWRRKGFVVSTLGQHLVEELAVPERAIRVALKDGFAELDTLEGKT